MAWRCRFAAASGHSNQTVEMPPATALAFPARGEKQGPAGCGRETSRGMKAGPRIGPAAEVGVYPAFSGNQGLRAARLRGGWSTGRRASLLATSRTAPVGRLRPASVIARVPRRAVGGRPRTTAFLAKHVPAADGSDDPSWANPIVRRSADRAGSGRALCRRSACRDERPTGEKSDRGPRRLRPPV